MDESRRLNSSSDRLEYQREPFSQMFLDTPSRFESESRYSLRGSIDIPSKRFERKSADIQHALPPLRLKDSKAHIPVKLRLGTTTGTFRGYDDNHSTLPSDRATGTFRGYEKDHATLSSDRATGTFRGYENNHATVHSDRATGTFRGYENDHATLPSDRATGTFRDYENIHYAIPSSRATGTFSGTSEERHRTSSVNQQGLQHHRESPIDSRVNDSKSTELRKNLDKLSADLEFLKEIISKPVEPKYDDSQAVRLKNRGNSTYSGNNHPSTVTSRLHLDAASVDMDLLKDVISRFSLVGPKSDGSQASRYIYDSMKKPLNTSQILSSTKNPSEFGSSSVASASRRVVSKHHLDTRSADLDFLKEIISRSSSVRPKYDDSHSSRHDHDSVKKSLDISRYLSGIHRSEHGSFSVANKGYGKKDDNTDFQKITYVDDIYDRIQKDREKVLNYKKDQQPKKIEVKLTKNIATPNVASSKDIASGLLGIMQNSDHLQSSSHRASSSNVGSSSGYISVMSSAPTWESVTTQAKFKESGNYPSQHSSRTLNDPLLEANLYKTFSNHKFGDERDTEHSVKKSRFRSQSRSPRRYRSKSPRRHRSKSPRRHRSRSPRRHRTRSPRRRRSRSPGVYRSRSPVIYGNRSFPRLSNSPRRSRSRSPKVYRSRSPGIYESRFSPRLSNSSRRSRSRSPKMYRSRSPGIFESRFSPRLSISPRRSRSRSPKMYGSRSSPVLASSPRRSRNNSPRDERRIREDRLGIHSRLSGRDKKRSSLALVESLIMLKSAIIQSDCKYRAEISQNNQIIDHFISSSQLKDFLSQEFVIKLWICSEGSKNVSRRLDEMIDYALSIKFNPGVYVNALTQAYATDIHNMEEQELIEYLSTDVVITITPCSIDDVPLELKDSNAHVPFRLRLGTTNRRNENNVHDRPSMSVFSRLGKRVSSPD